MMASLKRRLARLDGGRPRGVPDWVGTDDAGIIVSVRPEFAQWLGRNCHELPEGSYKVYLLFDPTDYLRPPPAE
jgi:hypothetical protein